MNKYIDAEKLIAEIEKLLAKAKNDEEKSFTKKDAAGHLAAVTKTAVCLKIKKLIATLQQEQTHFVDASKMERLNVDTLREWSMRYAPGFREMIEDTAYHFWNLAISARKEE